MFYRSAVLASAMWLGAAPVYAAGPYGSIAVGNWKGGAYTENSSANFSHCAAGTPYRSGIYFIVLVDAKFGWALGFAHESWRLTEGENIPIRLTFDGQAQFNVYGRAISERLVRVGMPDNSALIANFRKARGMTALAKGNVFEFSLDGTSALIPVLANCVKTITESGIKAARNFHLPAPSGMVQASPVTSSLKRSESGSVASELQIEALELATNFMLKSGLKDPKVVPRAGAESASYPTSSWQAEDAKGFVRIINVGPETKGLDVAAAVIAGDAKECKGKFASGRTSELIDSEVVFRGFVTCEDTVGLRMAQYFIVPRKKGGYVMFSLSPNMASEAGSGLTTSDRLQDFKKAALVAVSN